MLLRGQLTIAAGLCALGLALWTALAGVGTDASAEPHPSPALPEVGAFDPGAAPQPELRVDPVEPVLPDPVPTPSTTRPEAPPEKPAAEPPARKGRSVPPEVLARIPVPLPGAGKAGLPRLVAGGDAAVATASRSERVAERVVLSGERGGAAAPVRVEYTLDADLTRAIYDIFERGRVQLGLAVVLDPATGKVLAYAGTNPKRLPPGEVYPAASLVKVVTTAAALEANPAIARRSCRFAGNPYRLTPARVVPPKRGTEITL
jgi:hypothetical protein